MQSNSRTWSFSSPGPHRIHIGSRKGQRCNSGTGYTYLSFWGLANSMCIPGIGSWIDEVPFDRLWSMIWVYALSDDDGILTCPFLQKLGCTHDTCYMLLRDLGFQKDCDNHRWEKWKSWRCFLQRRRSWKTCVGREGRNVRNSKEWTLTSVRSHNVWLK